jgi:hypothetical protein
VIANAQSKPLTERLRVQGALGRSLFIFAKLNPGIKYVQGMNEVLAPLLYIFRTDPDEKNAVSRAEYRNPFFFSFLILSFAACKKKGPGIEPPGLSVGGHQTRTKFTAISLRLSGESVF